MRSSLSSFSIALLIGISFLSSSSWAVDPEEDENGRDTAQSSLTLTVPRGDEPSGNAVPAASIDNHPTPPTITVTFLYDENNRQRIRRRKEMDFNNPDHVIAWKRHEHAIAWLRKWRGLTLEDSPAYPTREAFQEVALEEDSAWVDLDESLTHDIIEKGVEENKIWALKAKRGFVREGMRGFKQDIPLSETLSKELEVLERQRKALEMQREALGEAASPPQLDPLYDRVDILSKDRRISLFRDAIALEPMSLRNLVLRALEARWTAPATTPETRKDKRALLDGLRTLPNGFILIDGQPNNVPEAPVLEGQPPTTEELSSGQ